jgi:hypothetical protein
MRKNPALFVNSEIAGQIPLVPSFASKVRCVSGSSGEGRKEGRKKGRKEERKEGRKEGRKVGRYDRRDREGGCVGG